MDSNPWIEEPNPIDGEWNIMSPEKDWCDFAAALARLTRTASLIVETGLGQGYVTRRLLATGRALITYETEQSWADMITPEWHRDEWVVKVGLADAYDLREADLVILDSELKARLLEWKLWVSAGKSGSWVLMHDTFHDFQGRPAAPPGEWALNSDITGMLLHNPRGSFLGVHP